MFRAIARPTVSTRPSRPYVPSRNVASFKVSKTTTFIQFNRNELINLNHVVSVRQAGDRIYLWTSQPSTRNLIDVQYHQLTYVYHNDIEAVREFEDFRSCFRGRETLN